MNTAIQSEPRVRSVSVTDDAIIAHLADGRVVSVPLSWSWRLSNATPKQRQHYKIIGSGQGVHWPDVDEDISVDGMLRGIPARRPSRYTVVTPGGDQIEIPKELFTVLRDFSKGTKATGSVIVHFRNGGVAGLEAIVKRTSRHKDSEQGKGSFEQSRQVRQSKSIAIHEKG